jgi:hypothetical protein
MLTEREKEIFVLIVTQITEKGVKECIDNINASPRNSMIDCLEAHQKTAFVLASCKADHP